MMGLQYENKKSKEQILTEDDSFSLYPDFNKGSGEDIIIEGDNLLSMKCLLNNNMSNSVDLVYIDPPFSTNSDFTIGNDRTSTVSKSTEDELAYEDKMKGAEYIEFIRERLILIHQLLRDTGSIYLHIDYKIGHYVKVIMDEIFGANNFRSDITRIKCNPKNFSRKGYGNIKDMILFYTKSNDFTWNEPYVKQSKEEISRLYKKKDASGRLYTTVPIHAPGETKNGESNKPFKGLNPPKGRHWRTSVEELERLDEEGLIEWSKNGVPRKIMYADEGEKKGKKLQDIWEYKDPQYPSYPTEKNINLFDLIIKTSSNPGDLVMDCFMGSGNFLLKAKKLKRKWIGIDSSEKSISVFKENLRKTDPAFFSTFDHYSFLRPSSKIKKSM